MSSLNRLERAILTRTPVAVRLASKCSQPHRDAESTQLWPQQLVPTPGNDHLAVLHLRYVKRTRRIPILSVVSAQIAILSLRCWALFHGNRVVLGILVSVYLCCLALQIVRRPN